jgi:hypothetical protein
VRPLVVGYTWALCRAIASCAELLGVLRLLEEATSTLLRISDTVDQPCTGTEAPDAELPSCRQALLVAVAAAAAAPAEQRQLLRHHLHISSAFQDLAETLLTGKCAAGHAAAAEADAVCLTATDESSSHAVTQRALSLRALLASMTAKHTLVPAPAVVAPDWLPRFSQQQREQLFDAWFAAAPAAALLPVLARCVGAVWHTPKLQTGSSYHGARGSVLSYTPALLFYAAAICRQCSPAACPAEADAPGWQLSRQMRQLPCWRRALLPLAAPGRASCCSMC